MTSRLNHLLKSYHTLLEQPQPVVMATIIETMGSTYQKAGARMLISANGNSKGLLSGGCFENDLREQAAPVFADGEAKQVFYDMRSPDDAIWGLGLGCNGAVRVLLQLLQPESDYQPLDTIARVLDEGMSGVLATVCASDNTDYPVGNAVFINPEQPGEVADSNPFCHQAQQVWLRRQPQLQDLALKDQTVTVFYDIIEPPPALLLIGAGPDAVPVTGFAATLGWRTTLVDHRPEYLQPERFPNVEHLFNLRPEELGAGIDLNRFAAMVLMTHNIDYDERYLQASRDSVIPYIGLLGPAKRRDQLLTRLGNYAERIRGRLFGPVGLDLGAETPEEIALSIVSEIQASLKQRDGISLRGKDGPIQQVAQN